MDALFCPNDGSPLSLAPNGEGGPAAVAPDPYLGRELSGHIEIRQLVGVGAMGRVYRAFQKGIERDVAVKILHRELSANQQLVARFHREAKVASRLLHPNVVSVHLVGQLPAGEMYIVMEYLDGLSLQSALAASGGAFDLPRALHVALQLCDATGEAHATGVVHRDLKPENVMLVRRGADPDFVKVLDFGIARLNWGEQSMATAAGLIFGTARYISPEGAQGEAVGPPGDVYAAATLIYQLLSGRTPFEGEQAVALLVQQIHDPPPQLRSIARASNVPEPIARVIMNNLAKDPVAREPDGRAFGHALIEAAKASGLSPEDLVSRPLLQRASSQAPPLRLVSDPNASPIPLHTVPLRAAPAATPAAPAAQDPPGVDTTMDDIVLPVPLPKQNKHPHDQTQQVEPLDHAALQRGSGLPPMRASYPSNPVDLPPTAPRRVSHVDVDEEEPLPPELPEVTRRRARSRMIFLFVTCFLVAVIGTTGVAYHFGYVGPGRTDTGSLESYRDRANKAFHAQHWDAPPGDNVRDLTNDGLAKYPHDPRLLEIRAQSTDQLVKDAVGERYQSHIDQATHLAELAHELDPTDVTATNLVDEYHKLQAATDAGVPVNAHDAGAQKNTPPQNGNVAPLAHGTMDVTPARPQIGQPVELVVHLAVGNAPPKTSPTDGSFTVVGPGVPPGTKVPSLADGTTTVRGALAFLQPGKFELTFTAKVDGAIVKIVKNVQVDPLGGPVPTTTNTAQAPDGGKWM